jgi:glycosyltransferase involved in cell wall biosynthesis
MLRRAVHKARCVLTVTNAVKTQIENELGAKDVVVTPNGVDPVVPSEDHESRGDYVLFVGNDKPHKNVGTAVEAAKRAGVRLVLAGAPFERFGGLGFVDDEELSRLYANALALVMPSIEEGFGLPAAEAMAHGTPVIASTAPALVEITGDAALHIDAHDVDGFANAMRRIANDRELRARLGANAVRRARLFTWKRCAETTREAYERARIRGTSWNVG